MDLIPGGVQACGSNHLMHFLNIFHINGYMIDRTGFQLCGLIFICLDHKITQLQKSDLLIGSFVYRLKCHLESKCFIKFNSGFHIICWNSNVLDPVHLLSQIHF